MYIYAHTCMHTHIAWWLFGIVLVSNSVYILAVRSASGAQVLESCWLSVIVGIRRSRSYHKPKNVADVAKECCRSRTHELARKSEGRQTAGTPFFCVLSCELPQKCIAQMYGGASHLKWSSQGNRSQVCPATCVFVDYRHSQVENQDEPQQHCSDVFLLGLMDRDWKTCSEQWACP